MSYFNNKLIHVFVQYEENKIIKELKPETKIKDLYDFAHNYYKITPVSLYYNKLDLAPHMHKTLKDYFKNRTSFTVDVSIGQKNKGYNEYTTNKYSIQYNAYYSKDSSLLNKRQMKNYIDFDISYQAKRKAKSESYDFNYDSDKLLNSLKTLNGNLKNYNENQNKFDCDNQYKLNSNFLSNVKETNTILYNQIKGKEHYTEIEENKEEIDKKPYELVNIPNESMKLKKLDTKISLLTKVTTIKEQNEKSIDFSPIKETPSYELIIQNETENNSNNLINNKYDQDILSKLEGRSSKATLKKTSRINFSSDPTSLMNLDRKRK